MPSNLDQPHPQLHLLSSPTKGHVITFCSVLEPDWIPIGLLQYVLEGEICSLCYSKPAAHSASCFALSNSERGRLFDFFKCAQDCLRLPDPREEDGSALYPFPFSS